MDRFGDLESGSEVGDFDYEDDDYNEFNPKPEANAYDRTGMPGSSLLNCGDVGGNFGDIQKKINRMVHEPEQRFACYVDAICRNLANSDHVQLGQEDIDIMIGKIRNIKDVGKKNPTAYILGYMASRNGMRLDKNVFDNVVKRVLPLVDASAGVTPPDIIRYSRLWETL